jgi:hypothetical protein
MYGPEADPKKIRGHAEYNPEKYVPVKQIRKTK